MKIEYLKLSTGEDVIAQLSATAGDIVEVKNAMVFGISREGVGMMPYAPFAKDQKITLHRSHIVAHGEPDDEIKNVYNSKFGSGIVVASAGGIQIPQ